MLPCISDRSQTLSKCGENKKVGHQPMGECVIDVLPHLYVCFDLFSNSAQQHGIYVYHCIKKETKKKCKKKNVNASVFQ